MARGIIYVESGPISPEREEEYNKWYDEIHLPDVVATEGYVSARRFAPVADGGPYIAIYEIEGDDLQAIYDRMYEAYNAGKFRMSDSLKTPEPPVVRLLAQITEYAPESV
ncbi:hypothetical protein ACFYVR_05725 [Rhodococcus sp. NPDC003318]|uniref:hypothetical protein n=1 Tax=Rhodococcus sp. NPDC003318 TaxID=3364503 RepID=UPI0036A6F018